MADKQAKASHEDDRRAFAAALPDLLKVHEGKYALVHGGVVVGTFDSLDGAYREGVGRFGLDGFYVGRIAKAPDTRVLPALMHGLIHARL